MPLLVAAGTLAACGPGHGNAVGTPQPTGRAAQSPSPSPTTPNLPLLAVLDHPFGAAPNTLRLLRADGGGEVAHIALDPDAEAVATSGVLVLVAGAGHIRAYGSDGGLVTTLTVPDGPNALVRGLTGDDSSTRWFWATVTQNGDSAVSRIYTAGPGIPPTMVMSSTAPGRAQQPLDWTPGGPVVSDEPLGIGGYVLFRRTFGSTGLLDMSSRTVHPLTDASCAYSDMALDGSVACVLNGREAPNSGGPVTLRVTRTGAPPLEIPLGSSVQQAGAALFSPDGKLLTLASSPALGEGAEQITMELVDPASGARHAFGAAGLMPVDWLPDGRLVTVRLPGVEGGDAGTYVLDSSGTATLICTASTVMGVLR
ncbi:MAG TPA: hypothetical protein VN193_17520 [Candidatus Angelobacter sp.]|jgi:hypothetical protein|nr:hypothetical protein [Candidatus Angelobacter sp.]